MKISFRVLTVLTIALLTTASCRKTESNQATPRNTKAFMKVASGIGYPGSPVGASFCGVGVTRTLFAGQNINAGTVMVNKDFNTGIVYVTYTAAGNWYFNSLHLYIGEQSSCAIPVNSAGAPVPGQFPYQADLSTSPLQSYTFAITGLTGNCFCIAAHADMAEIVNGQTIQMQTGWGDGTQIMPGGNWSTKFDVCITDCSDGGGTNGLR